MAVDIGPKIGIEGEAQYRQEINNIITQAKTLSSEMRTVESSFDKNTSAEEKAAKKGEVLSKQIDVQKERVKLLSEMYERSKETLGENDNATLKWKQALNNATTDLNKMEHELEETKESADGFGEEIKESTSEEDKFIQMTKKMEALEKASEYLNKASEYAKKFATTAVDAAKELDVGYDTIATKTGATGDALKEFNGIADDIFGSMPSTMEDVGKSVGEVNTRLGLTGDELKGTSQMFLQFARINDTDVSNSVDTVQKALAAFGLDASDTARILDVMTAAGQASGVGMDELAGAMVKNAGALSELGLSAEQSIMFIGRLEKSGVDSETALSGMSRALKNATKQGVPFDKALADLENTILNGTDSMDGLSASYDLFGRSGDKIYNAVKTGSISFKDLTGSVEDYSGTVENTYKATLSPWDETTVAMNNLKRAGSNLAGSALSTLAPAIQKIGDFVSKLADGFDKLPAPAKKVIGGITGIGAVGAMAAPKVLSVVKAIEGFKIAQQVSKGFDAMTAAQQASNAVTETGAAVTTAATIATEGSAAAAGVDAAAKGTEAAATTGATAAQEGLNAAMLANPIGILVAALGGLAIATIAYAKHLRDSNKEAYETVDRMKEIQDSASGLSERLDEVGGASDTEAKRVSGLVDRMKELNDKTNLTADEQDELKVVVGQLNKAMPELGATIDSNTGKLAGNTSEIYKNADAMLKNIDAQAKAKVLESYYDELAQAQKDLIEAQEAIANGNENAAESTLKYVGTMGNYVTGLNGTTMALSEHEQALIADGAAYLSAVEAQDAAQSNIDELQGRITKLTDELGTEAIAAQESADATGEMGGGYSSAADEIEVSASEIEEANQKILDSISNTVSSSIGLFEEFDGGAKLSADEILNIFDGQIAGVTNWENNLAQLLSMGGSNVAAFVQSLYEQGPQSANAVQALVDGGAEKLNEIATKWNQKQTLIDLGNEEAQGLNQSFQLLTSTTEQGWTGVQSAATTGAQNAVTASRDGLRSGGKNLNQDAYDVASGIGTNMAAGERSGGKQVQGAAQDMVSYADVKPYANSLATHMSTIGQYITAQFAAGIKTNGSQVFSAMKSLTNQVTSAQTSARTAGTTVGQAVGQGITQSTPSIRLALTTLVNAIKSNITAIQSVGSTANKAGANVAASVATGISGKVGAVRDSSNKVANAAKDPLKNIGDQAKGWGEHLGQNFANGIANKREAAKSEARKTADAVASILKHSTPKEGPLKDDDVWGEHLAENFANGIAKETPMVRAAALNMAKAAAVAADPLIDPSVVSGRGALGASITESIDLSQAGLDPDAVYAAIRSGASNIKLYVGERELGRVLRDMGVEFAA